MIACTHPATDPFTGKTIGCPNPPEWRRHLGEGNCWEHDHTLHCTEHARVAAPRDQFTPITDIEGIYQHDGTHDRHHRTAPRQE